MDHNNVIFVTVLHGDRSFRETMRFLTKAIIKRMKQNKPVKLQYLADSSAVRHLVSDAEKAHINCGGEIWWNKEYRNEARQLIAERIIDDANEELENDPK